MEIEVIVIVGPTCSGKTQISLKLASLIPSEIISADSRQVFKHLDIGTAKPSKSELKKIPHHLINVLEPSEYYNASIFEKDCEKIIDKLFKENKSPVVVGGSGLYIQALVDGIFEIADIDEDYRKDLLKKRKDFGNEFLYKELKKVDPESASKMLPQNWKRIIRALEVYHSTGIPIWKHHKKHLSESNKKEKYKFMQFGLNWEREKLYKNIDTRVDEMIEKGIVEEVRNILKIGYGKDLNSLNTVGYKEIIQYLEGNINLERAVELIKRNTRHYAKRQLTWFKKDKRIIWSDIENFAQLDKTAENILKYLN